MVHHYQRPVGGQEAPNISAGLFALASNDSGIDGTSGFFPYVFQQSFVFIETLLLNRSFIERY